MKKRHLFIGLACALLTVGQTGCDTTDQGFSGAQMRANLRQVKVGLTTGQVLALLGRPARINKLTTANGTSEAWLYYDSQFRTMGQAMAVGALEGTGEVVRNNPMTLVFINGKVTSIETNQ